MIKRSLPKHYCMNTLEKLAIIERGRFSVRPRNNPAYYNGQMPFVQTGDVSASDKFLVKYSQTLNDKGVSVSKVFSAGTILVTIAANIGDAVITTFPVACPDSVVCISAENCDTLWLYYTLVFHKNVLNALATQNAQKNINLEILKPLKILTPPLPEQEKIARILSCWDEAVEQMQNLIIEKKELKRGIMQQLLTGKVRLQGFKEKWKQMMVQEVAAVSKGVQLNRVDMIASGYPVFNGGTIESGFTNKWNTEKNTTIISEGGNSCGFVNYITTKFWAGGHCYIVSPKESIDKIFLYQLLKYQESNIMKLRVGSGLPNIQQTALNKFKLFLPPEEKEQRAIADILMSADAEIDLLNKKLDILKEQKKGLMQKLLTGEIRIKVEAE